MEPPERPIRTRGDDSLDGEMDEAEDAAVWIFSKMKSVLAEMKSSGLEKGVTVGFIIRTI